MAATDTSFLAPLPSQAERPGVDEREHPGGLTGRGSEGCIVYLREMQERVLMEASLRDPVAERRQSH